MKRLSVAIILVVDVAMASAGRPVAVNPERLHWISPSAIPGLQIKWGLGADTQPEPYVMQVKLTAGTTIAPHTHPDARTTAVLEGTLYVAFAETLDVTKAVAIPAGAVYITPANTPHFVLAKDADTVYQEFGSGPTATSAISPSASWYLGVVFVRVTGSAQSDSICYLLSAPDPDSELDWNC